MTLILELGDSKEAALKAKAKAHGVSAEQYVLRMVDLDLETPSPAVSDTPRRHISEVIDDIMSDAPREVLETLPRDGASEHDNYLVPRKISEHGICRRFLLDRPQ